jgi:hypothetical protein
MDVTTHTMPVMEAGGVTVVPEVPKVTHQVPAVWGWLPGAMWSTTLAAIGFYRIRMSAGYPPESLIGDLLHLDLGQAS